MLDFLLSLFNIWVWLFFGVLVGATLLIAYLKYGPDEYYEPFECRYEREIVSIHVDARFNHIDFKKINGMWYPRINLRNEALKEAKHLVLLMLPCMLVWSYFVNQMVNQMDHIEPDGTVIKAK